VVERLPPEEKIGMFVIPDAHQQACQYATVLAAGPQAQGILDDMGIKVGDTIAFGKFVGVRWAWQPEGTDSIKDRQEVDLVNVDDIFGCRELADKMFDGRLGISLYTPPTGEPEYRFFEEVERRAGIVEGQANAETERAA